jgi:hypothetical protein
MLNPGIKASSMNLPECNVTRGTTRKKNTLDGSRSRYLRRLGAILDV